MKIVLATRNAHKVQELRQLLDVPGLQLLGATEFPGAPEVVEDGDTFTANALKKARALAVFTGITAMADDSGLGVDALDGRPGVRSARYAGEAAKDADNVRKLLAELEGQADRRAGFRCVIALVDPHGKEIVVEGACRGRIIERPRGAGGFGYDPVFVPDGYDLTFAELSSGEKNRISHRGRALAQLRELLNKH